MMEDRILQTGLLEVRDLHVVAAGRSSETELVRGVSLAVEAGRTLAVVGESGSGKTMTALALMGLLPSGVRATDGSVRLGDRELLGLDERAWESVRGREMGMIFQDPSGALNPCLTVGYQVAEMFRRHQGAKRHEARRLSIEVMSQVGIPDAAHRFDDFPHQFSGGMKQRMMIAIALAINPEVLIADEPTTALDVTVQAQILRLLRTRRDAGTLAQILISHDLGVVARAAETVAVMYAGRIVEYGAVSRVYDRPAHPYTKALMEAVPARVAERTHLDAIPGQPPDPAAVPSGCAFHPRCPLAREVCRTTRPELRVVGDGRTSACHFAEELLGQEPETQKEGEHG